MHRTTTAFIACWVAACNTDMVASGWEDPPGGGCANANLPDDSFLGLAETSADFIGQLQQVSSCETQDGGQNALTLIITPINDAVRRGTFGNDVCLGAIDQEVSVELSMASLTFETIGHVVVLGAGSKEGAPGGSTRLTTEAWPYLNVEASEENFSWDDADAVGLTAPILSLLGYPSVLGDTAGVLSAQGSRQDGRSYSEADHRLCAWNFL